MADYARGVLGADRYRRYLDHHARQGCGHPPLTEKEYWRSYYAHQEDNPGARCC
ncbi:YbdD/YjiX family protein [Corynebacterium bovis]